MFMWNMTIDDYLEICERAKTKGIKPGESMEEVMLEYMREKRIKPIVTDFTQDEIIERLANDGKKILSIKTDEDGEQDIRFIKKEKDDGSDNN